MVVEKLCTAVFAVDVTVVWTELSSEAGVGSLLAACASEERL